MLARRGTIKLRNDIPLDLPRLVPSFSSKGFPSIREGKGKNRRDYSESSHALEAIGPLIKDSILISAYDLHHEKFKEPERFYNNKELVFIDSGGYELQKFYDSTEPFQPPFEPAPFHYSDYKRVLKNLPTHIPIVIANYDWKSRRKDIPYQIEHAEKLFKAYPTFLHNFIIKPTGKDKYLMPDKIAKHVKKLKRFDILGVTEKELADNPLDRLTNLAKLRIIMDKAGVDIPIHVWGGLDPIMTPLYFFMGAEIFDGISWLRYAYYKGIAVYRDSFGILKLGIEIPFDEARSQAMYNNIKYLKKLTDQLREFGEKEKEDFSVFTEHKKDFKKVYDIIIKKIK